MVRAVLGAMAGLVGLLAGAIVGFGLALVIATPRSDGTFAMREMIVCLPTLSLVGLVAGLYVTRRFFGRMRTKVAD